MSLLLFNVYKHALNNSISESVLRGLALFNGEANYVIGDNYVIKSTSALPWLLTMQYVEFALQRDSAQVCKELPEGKQCYVS